MRRLIAFSFALVALQSCTERIDIELNDDNTQRLVVEGWISDQERRHEVELSLTTSYFYEQEAPRATGAVVTISNEEESWTLTEDEPGIYRTPLIAPPAAQWYTLEVQYQGETYTATSWMRPVAPIDSLYVRNFDPYEEYGIPDDPYYSVRLWTQELAGQGDAYMWKTFVNNDPVRDTLRELSFVTDGLYDGVYVADIEIDYLDIETEAQIGDTVFVEQWNIGTEAYDIFVGIMNETAWNGGLFDSPPANVQTNMSNGALGYFGAAGLSVKQTIITE
ncbi:MAG: DUF4249 domain-containing protein [Flavobacteriales bacterium]|nr:DUF4249 domain-containing protein [Flavobacteriales bacterium]